MVDLGLCGLALSALLFLSPSAIYLTYGLTCYGKTDQTHFCWNVTSETAAVLVGFGFVFLIFGTITCGFTFLVWRSNVNDKEYVDNEPEIKENWSDWV